VIAALLIPPAMFAAPQHVAGRRSAIAAASQWWSANVPPVATCSSERRFHRRHRRLRRAIWLLQRATCRSRRDRQRLRIVFMRGAYVSALLILHLIVPRLQPAPIDA
jgi:hypothetical protein